MHTLTKGLDVFASEEDALEALRARYGSDWSEVKRGCMLVGAVLAPPVVKVLLVSEVRRDALPGGHEVISKRSLLARKTLKDFDFASVECSLSEQGGTSDRCA